MVILVRLPTGVPMPIYPELDEEGIDKRLIPAKKTTDVRYEPTRFKEALVGAQDVLFEQCAGLESSLIRIVELGASANSGLASIVPGHLGIPWMVHFRGNRVGPE